MPQNDDVLSMLRMQTMPNINATEGGVLPPEILAYLQALAGGNLPENERQQDRRRPLDPTKYQMFSPAMGVQQLLENVASNRAFNRMGQGLIRGNQTLNRAPPTNLQPPGNQSPPPTNLQPPGNQSPPPTNLQPPGNLQPGSPFANNPFSDSFDLGDDFRRRYGLGSPTRSFNSAPESGALEVAPTNNSGPASFGGSILERIAARLRGQTTIAPGVSEMDKNTPTYAGLNRGGQGDFGNSLDIVDENEAFNNPNDRFRETREFTPIEENIAPPSDEVVDENTNWYNNQLDQTTTDLTATTPSNRQPPGNQPPTFETPPPAGEEDRTSNMRVISQDQLQSILNNSYPRPAPFRFGMTEDQSMALRGLSQQERTDYRKDLEYQWTPQYTEVTGGRRWIVPATGEVGFTPTPHFDHIIGTGGVRVPTVTLHDQFGRATTYVLEPGTTQTNPNANTQTQPNSQAPPTSGNLQTPPGITAENSNIFTRGVFGQAADAATLLKHREGIATSSATSLNTQMNELRERGDLARQTTDILNGLESLLNRPEQIMTGELAERWMQFTRTVNGVLRAAGAEPFFDESTVSVMEAIQKLNTFLGSAAARQLTNRPTQFDFQAFLGANPGLRSSPEGSRLMIAVLRSMAERDIQLGTMALNRLSRGGRTGDLGDVGTEIDRIYRTQSLDLADRILNTTGVHIPTGFRWGNRQYVGPTAITGTAPIRNPNNWRIISR